MMSIIIPMAVTSSSSSLGKMMTPKKKVRGIGEYLPRLTCTRTCKRIKIGSFDFVKIARTRNRGLFYSSPATWRRTCKKSSTL